MNTYNSRSKKNINVTTIWNGTTWSTGTPSTYMIARIQGTYSTLTNGAFSCLDMYLDSNKITIDANTRVSVLRNITQTYSGTHSVIVQDLGELALLDPNVDVSTVKLQVYKTFKGYKRLDYILTGTPIFGKTLQSLSPSTLSNRFASISSTNSGVTLPFLNYTNANLITSEIGMGYIVRTPNTFPNPPLSSIDFTLMVDNITGTTSGTFSAGVINRELKYDGSNLLLCNPYTARIDFRKFYEKNKDKIQPYYQIYEETVGPLLAINETGYPWKSYTLYSSALDNRPTYILPMQGFYVGNYNAQTQSVIFTPDMMILGQDFDTPDRISFKMTSAANSATSSQLHWPIAQISYEFNHFPRTTASIITTTVLQKLSFYNLDKSRTYTSLTEQSLRNDLWLKLQSFGSSTYSTAPTASISINTTSGYFATASVYIYDYEAGVSQDLKVGPYTFAATYSVTYTDRFKISFS